MRTICPQGLPPPADFRENPDGRPERNEARVEAGLFKASRARERCMALWTWRDRLRSRRASPPPRHNLGRERLEEANRQVAQSERLVAGWREVIDRMEAEGRDVTVARDLLETFQGNLQAHRSNRNLIQQMIEQRGG
jgi:hypothetical protein